MCTRGGSGDGPGLSKRPPHSPRRGCGRRGDDPRWRGCLADSQDHAAAGQRRPIPGDRRRPRRLWPAPPPLPSPAPTPTKRRHPIGLGRHPGGDARHRPPPRRARTCRRLRARHPHAGRHRVRTARSPRPFSRRTDSPRRQLRRGRVYCDRNRRPSSCSAGCAQAGLRHLSTTAQPHSSKWPRSF